MAAIIASAWRRLSGNDSGVRLNHGSGDSSGTWGAYHAR